MPPVSRRRTPWEAAARSGAPLTRFKSGRERALDRVDEADGDREDRLNPLRFDVELDELVARGELRAPAVGTMPLKARADREEDVDAGSRRTRSRRVAAADRARRGASGWVSGKTPFAFGVRTTGHAKRSATATRRGGPSPRGRRCRRGERTRVRRASVATRSIATPSLRGGGRRTPHSAAGASARGRDVHRQRHHDGAARAESAVPMARRSRCGRLRRRRPRRRAWSRGAPSRRCRGRGAGRPGGRPCRSAAARDLADEEE